MKSSYFFLFTSPPLLPPPLPASCPGAVSDISDPGFLSVLADRGAADRHWGNFPGSGKSADNHTFHGAAERTLAVQRWLGEFLCPLPIPSVRVCFCLLVLFASCSFLVCIFFRPPKCLSCVQTGFNLCSILTFYTRSVSPVGFFFKTGNSLCARICLSKLGIEKLLPN